MKSMKKIPVKSFWAVLLAVALTTTGCYHRVDIPREQMVDARAFGSPSDKDRKYFVAVAGQSKPVEFSSMKVEDGKLIGQVQGIKGVDQSTIPLSNVDQIQKKELSVGLTSLAVL